MDKRTELEKDSAAVELIHANALRILEEIGIALHSEGALALLRENGVRVEGNRAYFTEEQVMSALDAATKEFTVRARNPRYDVNMNMDDIYMTPGYGSPSVCEADGTVRTATFDDFLKLAVIVQESEEFSINGGILAQPSDIDADISAEAMVYATICRSDKALFSVCGGRKEAKYGALMAKRGARGHSPPATRHRLPDACAWFRGMICRYARNQDGNIYGKRKSGILRRWRHASSR